MVSIGILRVWGYFGIYREWIVDCVYEMRFCFKRKRIGICGGEIINIKMF